MRMVHLALLVLLSVLLIACKPVSLENQQATATTYEALSMTDAMQAAEDGALALCAVDVAEGPDAYAANICSVSTRLACQLISEEIADSWQELVSGFSSEKMACTFSTSRLLEEGEQYGMPVQSWRVLLKGVQGFSAGEIDQEYWLQTAEEDGHWKFNRLLSNGEISFYLELQKLEEEGYEGEAK